MAIRQKPEEDDLEENVVVAATFKVLVLGNSNVGKSSLIKYYSTAEKPEKNMMPTIGLLLVCQCMLEHSFSSVQIHYSEVCGSHIIYRYLIS